MKSKKNKISSALSDKIYQKLYKRIIAGKLKPGQRITELQIAKSEGVSQAPVREAITRLATDGLVRLVPRSGCYICELNEEDIKQIYDIRLRLEDLALEYAFENLDISILEKLREKFLACFDYDDKKLIREELKLDSKFHNIIFEGSQSEHLQTMLNKLLARVHVLRSVSSMNPEWAKVALKKHIAILDAIINDNRKEAIKLLEEHIERSRENALANADFFKKQ